MCLISAAPAEAACTALTDGVVPLFRLSPTGSGTVFTESTTTATAIVEGAIAYDTTNDVLKVCDGTNWLSAGGGGGGSSQWTTTGSDIYYNTGNVGIGTTAPDAKLTVAGSINAIGGGFQLLNEDNWNSVVTVNNSAAKYSVFRGVR